MGVSRLNFKGKNVNEANEESIAEAIFSRLAEKRQFDFFHIIEYEVTLRLAP